MITFCSVVQVHYTSTLLIWNESTNFFMYSALFFVIEFLCNMTLPPSVTFQSLCYNVQWTCFLQNRVGIVLIFWNL